MDKQLTIETASESQAVVAVVEEDRRFAQELLSHLQRLGFETRLRLKLSEVLDRLPDDSPDYVLISLRSPEALDLKLLKAVATSHPDLTLIALLAADLTSYEELLRQAGIQRVLSLELKPRQLADVLMTMAELQQLETQNYRLRQMLDGRSSYENLIGGSLPMRAMYRLLDQIARTDSPVLITGEDGTERVDVAKAIHQKSERTVHPSIIVDCRKCEDDPDGVAIFGPRGRGNHGAGPCPRTSVFAKAGKGTVVLHRIEMMHIDAQKRLLNFMHRPFFQDETPGTPQPLSRIIATSGSDLLARVEAGKFLRELFYRLNILQVRVPPLRERREDIPMLAQYYLRFTEAGKNGSRAGRGLSFTSRALLNLFQHDWKGNLGELRDLVEAVTQNSESLEIDLGDLPDHLRELGQPPQELQLMPLRDHSLKEAKRHFESEYFKSLLKRTGGNMTMASRLSRVGRPYLYKKIREYNIKPEEFR